MRKNVHYFKVNYLIWCLSGASHRTGRLPLIPASRASLRGGPVECGGAGDRLLSLKLGLHRSSGDLHALQPLLSLRHLWYAARAPESAPAPVAQRVEPVPKCCPLRMAAIVAAWGYLFMVRTEPLVIAGRMVSDREKLIGASSASVIVVFFLTGVGSILFSALSIGLAGELTATLASEMFEGYLRVLPHACGHSLERFWLVSLMQLIFTWQGLPFTGRCVYPTTFSSTRPPRQIASSAYRLPLARFLQCSARCGSRSAATERRSAHPFMYNMTYPLAHSSLRSSFFF